MKEKDLKVSILYDFYAPLFSQKKKEVFEMYYFDDLSLAEISEHTGSTRQGVRELLVRMSSELNSYEEALGLWSAEKNREKERGELLRVAQTIKEVFPKEAEVLFLLSGQKGES